MIAIIFRTFTRDKQSFSPPGGWTKRSPPRGNNPCQLGDVRWQRHLLDLPMASYFCQVALITLMMVVVRILSPPASLTSQYGWPSTPRPRPSRKDQKPISEPCLRTPLKSIITVIIVLTVTMSTTYEGAGTVAGKWFREHFRSSRAFFPHRWWKNLTSFLWKWLTCIMIIMVVKSLLCLTGDGKTSHLFYDLDKNG